MECKRSGICLMLHVKCCYTVQLLNIRGKLDFYLIMDQIFSASSLAKKY